MTRRDALRSTVSLLTGAWAASRCGSSGSPYQLAVFHEDVTPPLGHPLIGGLRPPAKTIADPLHAHGLVLMGSDQPIVLAAIDWCEIRNEAYERWRTVLAGAAGTTPERVLVTCLHQHDAPLSDLEAQLLLEQHQVSGKLCDLEFHEQTVRRVENALSKSLESPREISHIGLGQAEVEKVASNRRYITPDGKVQFNRNSATRDAAIRDMPVGTIDPWLKTISFWDGDNPVAALSSYATHPMSYYGQGEVSCDFVGLARNRRQTETPSIAQIYVSGCSGDVTAGKYNDGDPANRPVLAERIYQGMVSAWNATERYPMENVRFDSVAMKLTPRESTGFTLEDLRKRLGDDSLPYQDRALAALGLSWRKRTDSGHRIDVPVVDFGKAQLMLMPGETFVQYQLWAQELQPESFVMVMGYGECATGYIPTAKAAAEGFDNHWMWVDPESAEDTMRTALEEALNRGAPGQTS